MLKENTPQPLHIKKPSWLKSKIPTGKTYFQIKRSLKTQKLFTVCEEAKCPNIAECWDKNTATFMILGEQCTRACRFCNVKTGNPQGYIDPKEPENIALSCQKMHLSYVVITMVDRDDLQDGGSEHISKVIQQTRQHNPKIKIELLAGDFNGSTTTLKTILTAGVEVFAHNLETVERLSPRVRDRRASYRQSLKVLQTVKEIAPTKVYTKSSLMLGLGETDEEILTAMQELRAANVDFLTLGQYMRPSKKHLTIKKWIPPTRFEELAEEAKKLGFHNVAAGPLVRSSYKAREFFEQSQQTS